MNTRGKDVVNQENIAPKSLHRGEAKKTEG